MRALILQHDHLSPPGPVAERLADHGYSIDEAVVVSSEHFHQPNQHTPSRIRPTTTPSW